MNIPTGNLSISDEWGLKSIEAISFLQTKLRPYEWWVVQTSYFGDNREAFTFFFPLVAGFMNLLGVRALWAAVLVEWSNLILKWIFKGDRPYWWIELSPVFQNVARPMLRQFDNTCESGPGSPSGHIMMNVALFYVISKGISKYYVWASKRYTCTKMILSTLIYTLFITWITMVTISRLYIQAHFIHQCVFGILFGLVIGHIAWSSKWLTRSHVFGSTVFTSILIGSSFLTYWFLISRGLNPMWAVPLAMKHCHKPELVHIDTQPFFIMVRFTAVSLGLGFGIASKYRRIVNALPKTLLKTVLTIKLGILLGKLLTVIQKFIPHDDLILYLSTNFGLYLVYPYMVITMLPHFLHLLLPGSK